jgi:hypothetical protein
MFFCDFCSIPMKTFEDGWTYKTKPKNIILVPETNLGMLDDGEWLACDVCSSLIICR